MKTCLKIMIAAVGALAIAAGAYFLFFFAKENDPKMLENVIVEKTAFPGSTVSECGEIEYTLTVKNENGRRVKVSVTDTPPVGTALKDGGSSVSFSATLKKGESASFSYKVRLGESIKEGDILKAPAAVMGEKRSNTVSTLVARTLDERERARMRDGILALSYSENIEPLKLLKDMYLVAFSESPVLASTPTEVLDMIFGSETDEKIAALRALVLPSLFGGSAVQDSAVSGLIGKSSIPRVSDLLIGDILFECKDNITIVYIYDGKDLVCLMDGCIPEDAAVRLSLLASAERYAVLRPSLSLVTLRYAMPEQSDALTEAQAAVIATAKAYLARGYRTQYDDSRMPYANLSSDSYGRGEFRWQIGQYDPEDYTSQRWGYLNCAAFTYECYRTALGLDLGARFTTYDLASHYVYGGAVGVPEYPYYFVPRKGMTEAQKVAEQNKFFDTLSVGDLVVVRRNNGNGHVMLYIGGGVLIHSSGASFNYNGDAETYEPTIRYMNILGYLFDPDATNYVFGDSGYISSLCLVRPLDAFQGESAVIPENTKNRVQNLENILSEKLTSHPIGQSVSVGGAITYTFRIKNLGLTEKTVEVKDKVPEGTALLARGDFSVVNGVLSASVTLAPEQTKEISYTVTVTAPKGSVIEAKEATVGGVLHTCASALVGDTLTEAEQAAILSAVASLQGSNPKALVDFALLNEIYKKAGLAAPFAEGADPRSSLMKTVAASNIAECYMLNEESEYLSMLVPTLYGGRRCFTPQQYTAKEKVNTDRSRLPREQALVVGDIVIAKFSSTERVYLYVGNGTLLNLSQPSLAEDTYSATERLMRMMSVGNYYSVLRPSLG